MQSTVPLPDGYPAVIGGLELEDVSQAEERVPFLAWIPAIGELFEDRSRNRSGERLFVFLRCSGMRGQSFEDLRWVSDGALRQAGLPPFWPELEPRIVR